ncbi:MAG: cation:proton antiporter [Phycisphaerales bacterium]|jgi:NhaP-type Na+/H+ or K+/H+ antiporter/predicted transcriptional regulator
MIELFTNFLAEGGGAELILPIGIAIFLGTVGAKIIQQLHIPQIIGYVTIGLILGPLFKIIPVDTVNALEPFNFFALGVIGFLIGGELERDIFVKFGKQVTAILLFEGLAAFLLVGVLSFGIMIFFYDWKMSLAVSVVFAAICAATDPASTVSVLWEYKARGPLTAMLTAVVALDDAFALVLYAVGISVAGVITGHGEKGLMYALGVSLYHIAGAIAIGLVAGLVLIWILKRIDEPGRILAFTVGTIIVTIGAAVALHLDIIIATMVLGVTLINIEPRRMSTSFEVMHDFSVPVYALFFVLVGARLNISSVDKMIFLLMLAYVAGSIIGKTGGAYLGAAYSKAVKSVRNYLGFCLYPQGGIAVGLLIMASNKFEEDMSSIMLLVVLLGAFVLQLIGPLGVKFGAKKAGELGLNITEEDLIKIYKVSDVMDSEVPVISAGMSLSEVLKIVSGTSNFFYPVVDNENKLVGGITLDGIRNTFQTQELNDWLVALDIMEPVLIKVTPEMALAEAFEKARHLDIEHMPVVASVENDTLVGALNCRAVHRSLSAEVLSRQQQADSIHHMEPV